MGPMQSSGKGLCADESVSRNNENLLQNEHGASRRLNKVLCSLKLSQSIYVASTMDQVVVGLLFRNYTLIQYHNIITRSFFIINMRTIGLDGPAISPIGFKGYKA
jgi:hypothetical protein